MRFTSFLNWKYLIIILLAILQLSFFKGLGWPWFNINLVLGLAIFWVIYDGLDDNLAVIIVGALIIDLFSSNIFGITVLAIFLACYLVHLIFFHLFTNQSLLSLLALGLIGSLLYNFFTTIFYHFFYWLNLSEYFIFLNQQYWRNLVWQVVFTLAALIIFYWVGGRKERSV